MISSKDEAKQKLGVWKENGGERRNSLVRGFKGRERKRKELGWEGETVRKGGRGQEKSGGGERSKEEEVPFGGVVVGIGQWKRVRKRTWFAWWSLMPSLRRCERDTVDLCRFAC